MRHSVWLGTLLLVSCGGTEIAEQPPPEKPAPEAEVWRFDSLESIAGHAVTVEGDPQIIETPDGPAIEFDGVDDAIFLDVHPLAGAETWTWEAVFRPNGGQEEQRWFHLNAASQGDGADDDRMLFEIRVVGDQWCLDTFVKSGEVSQALLDRTHLHPLDEWHHVAAVYDGRELRSYINGRLDGAAELDLAPQAPGRTAVGVRINKVFYFDGAVRTARFTKEALMPEEFLAAPARR